MQSDPSMDHKKNLRPVVSGQSNNGGREQRSNTKQGKWHSQRGVILSYGLSVPGKGNSIVMHLIEW